MRKKYLYILLVVLSFVLLTNPVYAQSKASSQFKSYDKRDDTDSVDYKYHAQKAAENNVKEGSLGGNLTTSGINMGIDKAIEAGQKYANKASQNYIKNVQKYVSDNMPAQSSYKNFKDYQ